MKRRTAREKALQALFQMDANDIQADEAISNVLEDKPNDEYLQKLVAGTIEHKSEIDQTIQKHLEKWKLGRLAKVDRNILRLGVFEMYYMEDLPKNVAINEAIEIAKTFGDDQSSKFINGVLSKIKDSL
ncbi:transcription antitermination factor NusB [Falsibacillus albus]|uniref:Transcription antitermination protein NusB n=1 Tax=Falsibacillus albus TaxID=2478915 RepID=A0A3L7K7K3_9BACI|nr:transcription antitermination factor NusB [Falsibacillus albus]RLQ98279.1 transcription antitermination factor NusB [Falsibacillus albus]